MTDSLVRLDQATRMLAEIRTVDDARKLINLAEAARIYARKADLGLEAQNHAAEIKLRAQRRAGEVLAEIEKARGGGDTSTGYRVKPVQEPATYAEMDITKRDAHNWQTIAAMPKENFEACIDGALDGGKELTTAGVVREAKRQLQKAEAANTANNVLVLDPGEKRYRAIVIDPPWPVQKILRDERPKQDVFDYPTMTVEEIGKLPVADLADQDGCHVYLWVTHKFLPVGLQLFEQWGVKYECVLTWVKNVGFTPFSWMYSTEHVLFGRIGSLPLLRKGLRLDFEAKVEGHSKKPQVFFDLVKQVSPEPRIELFAREQRDGFTAWGNEI